MVTRVCPDTPIEFSIFSKVSKAQGKAFARPMPLPDPGESLDFLREYLILEGDLAPSIMRAQADRNATILIGPLRVMIHRLSLIADAQDKRHRLAKSMKFKGLRERVSFHSPAREIDRPLSNRRPLT